MNRSIDIPRAIRAQVPQKWLRDRWNRLRYGAGAPQSDEALFFDPVEISATYSGNQIPGAPRLRRTDSGRIIGGDWDRLTRPVGEDPKYVSCRMRFHEGADWPETPIWQRLAKEIAQGHRPDDCASLEDLRARYAAIDQLYEDTRALGRLRLQRELPGHFRREHGGILVHIDRDGRAMRSSGGMHRFAIARLLGLPEIPVQLGVCHRDAARAGLIAPHRQSTLM